MQESPPRPTGAGVLLDCADKDSLVSFLYPSEPVAGFSLTLCFINMF